MDYIGLCRVHVRFRGELAPIEDACAGGRLRHSSRPGLPSLFERKALRHKKA